MREWLEIIVLFSLAACLSPGPNNIMLFLSGVNFGIRRSLPHYLGVCFGYPIKIILISVGVAELEAYFPVARFILNMAAALFLSGYALLLLLKKQHVLGFKQQPLTYHQASLFQWLNTKGWIIAITAGTLLPDFAHGQLQASLLVGGCFLLVSLPCYFIFLFLGSRISSITTQHVITHFICQFGAVLLLISAVIRLLQLV